MGQLVGIFESKELTAAQYDSIINEMRANNTLAQRNRLSHVSFSGENGFCVIDLWQSEEALNEFAANVLMPIFSKLNIAPPVPKIYPAHSYMNVNGENA